MFFSQFIARHVCRFQGHDIIQREITQKRYKIYLQWRTNRKSGALYTGGV